MMLPRFSSEFSLASFSLERSATSPAVFRLPGDRCYRRHRAMSGVTTSALDRFTTYFAQRLKIWSTRLRESIVQKKAVDSESC
jgi:hypothetical protein